MKLKYKIFEKSQLDTQVLKNRILSQLAKEDYLIESDSIDTISFKDDIWKIRPKGYFLRRVDQGIFNISTSGDVNVIEYTYYIGFLSETVITAIILTGAFTLSPLIFIIVLPFWIQLGTRIYRLKDASLNMIRRLAH